MKSSALYFFSFSSSIPGQPKMWSKVLHFSGVYTIFLNCYLREMPGGAWDSQESLLYLLLLMWLCHSDCVLHSVAPKCTCMSRCFGWLRFWSSVKRRCRWRAPGTPQVFLDNEIPHQGLSMLLLRLLQPSGKHKYISHLGQQCQPEF